MPNSSSDPNSTSPSHPLPSKPEIYFSSFAISHQHFYTSPTGLSHALVNLRPLLPGHTLVIPHRTSARLLEDLSEEERADLLRTVVRLQRTLRRCYSGDQGQKDGGKLQQAQGGSHGDSKESEATAAGVAQKPAERHLKQALRPAGRITAFNVAMQDGPAAGQTVPHVHFHIIPRREGDMDAHGGGDVLYQWLEDEEWGLERHLKTAAAEGRDVERNALENGKVAEKGAGSEESKEGERRTGGFAPDTERKNRSVTEMRAEADWLTREMARDEE